MKEVKINNCRECPFVNQDNEYGFNACNLKDIELNRWEELPEDEVHKECPLREMDYLIELSHAQR